MNLEDYIKWHRDLGHDGLYDKSPELADPNAVSFKHIGNVDLPDVEHVYEKSFMVHWRGGKRGYLSAYDDKLTEWAKKKWPALKFVKAEDLNFYISKSGGFKENADEEAIYVLHPNGDTQKATLIKSLFQNSPSDKMVLYPGSVIFVPRAIDNSAAPWRASGSLISASINCFGSFGMSSI